ncbi:M50 family peptidase [Parashewanella curva]|uniref:M50 family peptidase n=1 Tax=Parashewanella curva TaxID=2338552 RepID=A0A3L8Q3I0_9GAMM|nr:M50 family metallopeptidase [Parashewanella curva]RLV61252.1 M50 family peptidase [Parashewanella curva]
MDWLDKKGIQFWIYLAVAAFLVQIPILGLPLYWFATFYHELSHGIATLLTGGVVEKIQLFTDGSGYCFSIGGIHTIIAFSGYLGTPWFGAMIFKIAEPRNSAITKILAVIMLSIIAVTLLFYVSDLLTFAILMLIAICFLASLYIRSVRWIRHIYKLFGVSLILNGLLSSLSLFGYTHEGDAAHLANLTWLPGLFWVALWVANAAIALFWIYNTSKTR